MTNATPPTVSAMPRRSSAFRCSPRNANPKIAVKGGTNAMSSMESREPITTNARNRHRSPNVKPTRPEAESQSQLRIEASVGNGRPRVTRQNADRRTNARHNLMRFTASEPTRTLADSNASAVTVQKQAVASAAISPAWDKGMGRYLL
jgi:hypothetical protein